MEKTPSCQKFRLWADEYIEGELTAAEMRDLEAHLAECEECRKEFEELRALKEVLRSAKEDVPDGLHSRIMNAIEREPKTKPRRRIVFYRTAAISAACIMICLSLSVFITMLPMWRGNTGGEADLPEDPAYALGGNTAEECGTMLKNESVSSTPADENIESEDTEVSEEMQIPEVAPDETEALPEATEAPQTDSAAEMFPATEAVETVMPETTKHYFKGQTNSEADDGVDTHVMEAPSAEATNAPGGEEITLALLIVSGLLAIASFIAFLISLSSIRNKPVNKGDQK